MGDEEALEIIPETNKSGLPCIFCRHHEECELWEDGREVCLSFSCQQ